MPFNNSQFSSLQEQMDFIRRHGEWVYYYTGTKCTCTMFMTGSSYPDANRANPTCQACGGVGLVWQPQGQILGLVTDITQEKNLMDAGIASPGDLIFSPDLRYRLTDYDKIQMTWEGGIPYEGDLIIKGKDQTMYGIQEVITCAQFDPTTGATTTFIPGVDFTFTQGQRNITWLGTPNAPADNTVYSIKYFALIDWIVYPIPQPRRERGTDLGQKVVLKKKHTTVFGK